MKNEKPIWIVTGESESGDDFGPKRYNEKPTDAELKAFILATGEEINCDGPGDFDSYVYLTVTKL